jgi:apolipoprotein N-acyltransferase
VGPRAADASPPEQVFQRRLDLRRKLSVVLLNLLTVALLSVSFPPFDQWYLGYVALVPWALALAGGTHRRWALLWAWLAGLLFWAVNLYWLWWITLVGYAALILYLSAYWSLAALIARAAIRRNWPMWLVLPAVWVALEYARAHLLSGFPWFYMAHTQYARVRLIQICDVTGQYGVSFFVLMVNGWLADLLGSPLFVRTRSGPRVTRRIATGLAAVGLTLGALLLYGSWRLSEEATRPGPVIGIVQQAFPVALGRPGRRPDDVLAAHVEAIQAVAAQATSADDAAALIVCPETMGPDGINPEFVQLDVGQLTPQEVRSFAERHFPPKWRGYDDAAELLKQLVRRRSQQARLLGEVANRVGCPVLIGSATMHRAAAAQDAPGHWATRNSALLFEPGPDSWKATQQYAKMHLVPFGEYVPFKRGWPWFHRFLRSFVPPVMEQLDPGDAVRRFVVAWQGSEIHLATPICYEGTFARVCRDLVMDGRRKAADVLVNISNDGWFVWDWGTRDYRGSTEHPQHLVHYVFRAVENRVPTVRAVNTGISASIDSCGRIVAIVELTVGDVRKRTMVAGNLLLDGSRGSDGRCAPGHGPRILVDRRTTLYSLVGDVFAVVVSAAAAASAVWLLLTRRKSRDRGIAR